MTDNIHFGDAWPSNAAYVCVLPFKGEEILLSQIYSRGWELPTDQRQGGETFEETARRLLMDQCGTEPLILGKLAYEEFIGDDGGAFHVVYFWGVVDDVSPSQSMEVGEPKFFKQKELHLAPMVQQKKVLYDAALEYAKIVAEQLSKVG